MKTLDNKSYALETYGRDPRKYHPYGGWRYLFMIYGRRPTQSFADEFFGWIYPLEISQDTPQFKVIVFEDIDRTPPGEVIEKINMGAYTAYIIKQ